MNINRLSWALLAFVALAASPASPSDPGFTTPAAKAAQVDHDKAIARAADTYRNAVALADKAYATRLGRLVESPTVSKVNGEVARVQAAQIAASQEAKECEDPSMIVAVIAAKDAPSPSTGLRKGLTKAEVLNLYPVPPDKDRIEDAGDTEVLGWGGYDWSSSYPPPFSLWRTALGRGKKSSPLAQLGRVR
jgi:hypothetical protein